MKIFKKERKKLKCPVSNTIKTQKSLKLSFACTARNKTNNCFKTAFRYKKTRKRTTTRTQSNTRNNA